MVGEPGDVLGNLRGGDSSLLQRTPCLTLSDGRAQPTLFASHLKDAKRGGALGATWCQRV